VGDASEAGGAEERGRGDGIATANFSTFAGFHCAEGTFRLRAAYVPEAMTARVQIAHDRKLTYAQRPLHLPEAKERTPGERLPLLAPAPRRRLPLVEARAIDLRLRPLYAVWELTLRCDLACKHCGSRGGKARADELDRDECLDLVRQLAELGVRGLTLIGGEAYLHPAWLEVVSAARERGLHVGMTTGGRGVTAELAEAAARAGLESASISLDGCQAAHDELRRLPGAFEQGLAAITHFRRASLRVGVNTQINRKSLPDLEQLLETIAAAGATSWQLQLTVPLGRAADAAGDLLQPYELLELFPRLAALKKRSLALGVHLRPANNLGYFGPFEALLREGLPRGHSVACTAGKTTLGIEADGAIKGCPSLPSEAWIGGNVRDASLTEIWQRAPALGWGRERGVASLSGFCATCYYAKDCLGGCTFTAFSLFGEAGNNPYCHHRALTLAERGLRERLVCIEKAPGRPFDHARFELVVEQTPTSGV
jgi:radical SAM protein with 4Fe4S-binding SPASM domain